MLQQFIDELHVGNFTDSDDVSTGFPCFKVNASASYGYLQFAGSMFGNDKLRSGM